MRVLFVWHAAVVSEYRERFRALRCADRNLDLHVLLPEGSWEGGRWVTYSPDVLDDYVIHRPGSWFTGHPNMQLYRVGPGWLRQLKPDVVHIHEEAWTMSAFQLVASYGGSVPLILESFENLLRPIKWPFRLLEPWIQSRVTAFVAVTPQVKSVLMRKGVQAPIEVIPYGTRVGSWTLRSPGQIFRVGYVGRLTEEKGIKTLLAAMELLAERRRVELVVVGNGPLAPLVRDFSDRPKFHYLEAVPVSAVPALMKTFDVLVLPSLTTPRWAEQFGRVLVEAMSVGTVPIGSDSGAIPWVIGDAGWTFSEGDHVMLARELTELSGNREMWRRLSDLAQVRVREHFTWSVAAERLLHMYYRLTH